MIDDHSNLVPRTQRGGTPKGNDMLLNVPKCRGVEVVSFGEGG